MHSTATPFGSALHIVYCFDNARVRTTELIAIVVRHQRICFGKHAQSHPFAGAWQRAEWKQLLARDPLLHTFVGSINDAPR